MSRLNSCGLHVPCEEITGSLSPVKHHLSTWQGTCISLSPCLCCLKFICIWSRSTGTAQLMSNQSERWGRSSCGIISTVMSRAHLGLLGAKTYWLPKAVSLQWGKTILNLPGVFIASSVIGLCGTGQELSPWALLSLRGVEFSLEHESPNLCAHPFLPPSISVRNLWPCLHAYRKTVFLGLKCIAKLNKF